MIAALVQRKGESFNDLVHQTTLPSF